ncbi:MAG: sporulation protein YqfD, partial [Bacilli bacterium]
LKIVHYYGKMKLYLFLKNNYIIISSIIVALLLLILLSRTCFYINIHTNNKEIIKSINNELINNKIGVFKLKKSYKVLQKAKKNILLNNKETLEWIEIKERGVFYDIYLTKRIKPIKKEESIPQDIVASKDALILKIIKKDGVVLKYNNDYVKKGETLISGSIYNKDTLISKVRADGSVYGEVWYTVNTTLPYTYKEYKPTGKVINHYYLEFNKFNFTLLGYSKETNAFSTKKVLLDKFFLPFKLIKEKKNLYSYKTIKLSNKEALKEALHRSDMSIKNKLNKDEYIISKKVLNNNDFYSKINIEVFYKVYENIGKPQTIKESEINE